MCCHADNKVTMIQMDGNGDTHTTQIDSISNAFTHVFKPPKKKKKRYDPATIMNDYSDTDNEVELKGPGSAKTDPFLDKCSILTRQKNEPDKLIYRCVGASSGCHTNWVHPHN